MNILPNISANPEPLTASFGKTDFVQSRARGIQGFTMTDTNEIMATVYPPIKWIVEGYLSEGLGILAGRQKLGKTWLAIDIAIAVATGGFAMGSIPCDQGDVLYIDMENGNRRIQRRIQTIFPNPETRPDLSSLNWVNETRAMNNGFIKCLENWRISVSKPRLVVIDVLQRIKPPGSGNRNAYENDYAAFADLQSWATENQIAILALHHTRKGGAEDPLEALTGSNGLSAVADTTMVLDRKASGMSLYVRGRDIEEKETAVQFDNGVWSVLGPAAEVYRSKERAKLLGALEDATEPLTPRQLADLTGMKDGNVRKLLISMTRAGEAGKTGYSTYIHPKNMHLSHTPGNTGNTGNTSQGYEDD